MRWDSALSTTTSSTPQIAVTFLINSTLLNHLYHLIPQHFALSSRDSTSLVKAQSLHVTLSL